MQRWESVTIVGAGLIGASIGLALRERELAKSVIGVGRRTATLRTARQRGAVTSTTTDLARGVRDSQLIVVCTPVEKIAEFVLEAAKHCPVDALITDDIPFTDAPARLPALFAPGAKGLTAVLSYHAES